jgi:uncharacterized membrane-anchored protein YjiN (DUF445 family)
MRQYREAMGRRAVPCLALAIAALSTVALSPAALAVSTHQEYVAEVNPICKSAAREAKRIPSRIEKTGNPFIDALQKSALYGKLLSKTIRRIAKVEPAPGEEAAVKAWLDEGRRQARLIRGLLRAVKHGNAKRAKVLIKRIARSQERGRAQVAALGLTACAGKQPI